MRETFERNGRRYTVIDISTVISNATSDFEPVRHQITYRNHEQGLAHAARRLGVPEDYFPDRLGWAGETVTLGSHSGTHVDAPYHYGPMSGGKPAKTIDQIPLQWCFGHGVLLDMTHKKPTEAITDTDVVEALRKINYEIQPYDIVLIRTDASKRFNEPGYDRLHPGLVRSSVKWLVERGVKMIGIDAWGLDRPFHVMGEEARQGHKERLWEAHFFGKEQEYLQIEKLSNLDLIPIPFGFQVFAFPVKLHAASAGWTRAVVVIEE